MWSCIYEYSTQTFWPRILIVLRQNSRLAALGLKGSSAIAELSIFICKYFLQFKLFKIFLYNGKMIKFNEYQKDNSNFVGEK
jgi:hypothetical protein